MTDIICPLCGKPNSPELEECQYCQAPLKTGGFLPPAEGAGDAVTPVTKDTGKPKEPRSDSASLSNLEQAVPDWLKETEASFLHPSESKPEEPASDWVSDEIKSLINPPTPEEPAEKVIDDEWLENLLAEAGAVEPKQPEHPPGETEGDVPEESQQEKPSDLENAPEIPAEQAFLTPPEEKPDWLASLEASSTIKLEGGMYSAEPDAIQPEPIEIPEEKSPEPAEKPEWLNKTLPEAPAVPQQEPEAPIAPAELPGWLEALRPPDSVSPTGPVEDVSGADIVTAGPLVGLRGVLSAQPSAIRVQKPPTYSIKLRVTDEQQSRLQMMEDMLVDEGKPRPLPTQPTITSRYIFRLIVALVLLLPIIWMIVGNSQHSSPPQPANVPGVIDFTQHIQALPDNVPVLLAFDYEAGFSGEMNIAIDNLLTQLMDKNAFLALVSTTSSGPALAESMMKNASMNTSSQAGTYKNYADFGYIPGGTLGLLGLATSPRSIMPYTLDSRDVWTGTALKPISAVKDFAAVIVITNDPDTARIWIEQVGPQLQSAGTPLLFILSSQAEPLIRPYYDASPKQVQGLLAGLAGGVAYAQAVGDYSASSVLDAYSAGVTISILILLIGSIAGVVIKMLPAELKREG